MRAIPSPIWRTVPTSARSVSTSYSSICLRRIEGISSGRIFTCLLLLVRVRDDESIADERFALGDLFGTNLQGEQLLLLGRRVREVSADPVEAAANARVDRAR